MQKNEKKNFRITYFFYKFTNNNIFLSCAQSTMHQPITHIINKMFIAMFCIVGWLNSEEKSVIWVRQFVSINGFLYVLFYQMRKISKKITCMTYVICILQFFEYQGPDHVQLSKVNWRLKVNWKFFDKNLEIFLQFTLLVVNHVD